MTFIRKRLKKISIALQNFNDANRWNTIHVLALTGLLLRIFVACISDQIHHPDEIFQYLEQAHRVVFGYGYIPWEFRFGTRSWILPGFISTFLYGFKFLKIDDPVLYINFVKVLFCCISTSLVYSVYITTRELASDNAGKIAATFVCFWYELIYFAHKPNPEVLAAYLFMAALAIAVIKSDKYKSLLFGIFCALVIILRVQYIIPVSFLIVYVLFKWERKNQLQSALVFFIIIGVAGYIDYLTWGKFFLSYYNNYVFNKVYNVASLFGTHPFAFYFTSLSVTSMGIFFITGLLSFIFLRNTWLLLLCVAGVIISHSIIPHKEHRFIFVVIPIFLMLFSIIVTKSIPHYRQILKKYFLSIIFSVFFIVSLAGSFNKLPFQRILYHRPVFFQNGILNAYLYLFKETDLHAILNISEPWHQTGGYYYLHRDIPIFSQKHLNWNDSKKYLPYISHIICPANYKDISGFKTIIKLQSVEIRKQVNPPSEYQRILMNTKNVFQKGIDGKYKPTIKK